MSYQEKEKILNLIVVKRTGPSLMGRDWLNEIRLVWWSLNRLETQTSTTLQKLLERHAEVFKEKLGRVKDAPAKIHVDANARPQFYRPRPVGRKLTKTLIAWNMQVSLRKSNSQIGLHQLSQW